MRSIHGFILVVLVALSSSSVVRVAVPRNESQYKNNAFDYLLFSQQSTEGYCRATGHCASDKVRDYWTIHGLWPTNATSWPQNCDPSHPFDPSKIANLRPELDKYWPSVTSENSDGFWSHEWSKHGTCAKAVPQLSGEYNYFSFTMTLYSKWNLTQYLNDAQIYPDNDRAYDISQIEDVLDRNLEAKANLVCENVRGLQYPLLTEIHFCLTKTLDVMDCPTKDEKCGNDSIYYIKSA